MSLYQRSLLDVDSLTPDSIYSLFKTASDFQRGVLSKGPSGPVVALLFFEPSTRTRLSFEMAALRLGLQTVRIDDAQGTSLAKGETLKDTLLNVLAMGPDAVVLRYKDDAELTEYLPHSPVPILIAGHGIHSHPTQALLDAYTIQTESGPLQDQRVLIVGDIAHSRVASSNIRLLTKLGAQVAICGPPSLLPQKRDTRVFETREEGLRWATVCMALRIQLERLDAQTALTLNKESYRRDYGLTETSLKFFSGLILHPGPINQNVELDAVVLNDPRCRVLTQVRNGVAIRASLLAHCLGRIPT